MGTVDGRCGILVSSNMASRGPVGRDCRRCWSIVEGWWDSIDVEMQVEFGKVLSKIVQLVYLVGPQLKKEPMSVSWLCAAKNSTFRIPHAALAAAAGRKVVLIERSSVEDGATQKEFGLGIQEVSRGLLGV